MTTIKVSVRNLVEFVLMHGDLQPGSIGASRAQEAIKAHQIIQKTSGAEYVPEVSLSYIYLQEDLGLEIKGRADGVIKKESGECIDEIKTTSLDLSLIDESFSDLHWAQAQCYAFMYAVQEGLETIEIQLTYFQLDTAQTKRFSKRFSLATYYETTSRQGYEFAYMYPGLNKVLQAVGRVIRTEEDRGIVLLIDERFSQTSYKKLFSQEWKKIRYVADTDSISTTIENFWSGGGKN